MIPIGFFFGGGKRTDQTAGHKEGIGGSMTIAWDDQFKRQNIMWKVPRNVRMNDNVVVREDEIAVFYRDGKVLAYLDRPDRYALTSQNAPILGRLIQALSGVVQQAWCTTSRSGSSTASSGPRTPSCSRTRTST